MLTGLPADFRPAVPLAECFDARYGLEITADDDWGGGMRARVPVSNAVLGPTSIVHGGVYAAIAEALAARGTITAVAAERRSVVGLANDTYFLHPILGGAINSMAICIHHDDALYLWEVEHSDDDGLLCALTRMTVAVQTRNLDCARSPKA